MSKFIPLLDDLSLLSRLLTERDIGDYQSVIGATICLKRNYLLDEEDYQEESLPSEEWTVDKENK